MGKFKWKGKIMTESKINNQNMCCIIFSIWDILVIFIFPFHQQIHKLFQLYTYKTEHILKRLFAMTYK